MNDTSTSTASPAGTNTDGSALQTIANLFSTGISAYYGSQTAQAYAANDPSLQFNAGYVQGQAAAQQNSALGGLTTQQLLLLAGIGVGIFLLVR